MTSPKLTMNGDDNGGRGNAELLGTDQWHDRALEADHAADKGIDQHQQGELRPVLPETESDGGHAREATGIRQ